VASAVINIVIVLKERLAQIISSRLLLVAVMLFISAEVVNHILMEM